MTRPKRSLRFSLTVRSLAAGLIAVTCLLAVLATRRPTQKPEGASAVQTVRAEVAAHKGEIVGNAACQPCHDTECRLFAVTAHANTLHLLDASTPNALRPPEGRIGKTPFVIRREGGDYWVEYPSASSGGVQLGETQQIESAPLRMAIGDGRKAIAYVTDAGSGGLYCVRFSFVPRTRQWFNVGTVSRELGAKSGEPGAIMPDGPVCIGCHAVTTPPADALTPPPERMGVGCESCHGPGGAHIIAMRRRLWKEPHIDTLRNLPAADVQTLCAKCHQQEHNMAGTPLPHDPSIDEPKQGHPTAFGYSRCYRESQGKFSCLSCHNPHTNVNANNRKYEAVCLNCHSGSKASEARTAKAVAGHVCPVNPRSGCIPCHMPRHEMMPEFDDTTTITSHYIGIYRKLPRVREAARTGQ